MPYYDPRVVPSHGDSASTVFLVNEAPGPCEAHYRIPSVGAQGGNIYRALRNAAISWAYEFEKFAWPILIQEFYKKPLSKRRAFELRDAFLEIRAKHIKCTNAYHLWPRSARTASDWVDPASEDVLSPRNIARLGAEVPSHHRVILVCGEFAWLACHGSHLSQPSTREGTPLSSEELQAINIRLSSSFIAGWYMGHTRRWTFNAARTSSVLRKVAYAAQWQTC